MHPFSTTAIVLLCLIPLLYALYYFGILVTRAGASWFRADLSLPTRWEGKHAGSSGLMRRNFAVFQKYNTLAVEVETTSGALDFQVNAPDGSHLFPSSGVYGRDARVLFYVGQLKRCSVTLRMEQFQGQFRITLQ